MTVIGKNEKGCVWFWSNISYIFFMDQCGMACIHVKHNRAIRAVHTKKGLVFCWLLCLLAHWVPPPTIACLHTPKTPLPLFLPTCVCWLTSHLLKPHCPPPTCLFLLQQPPPEPKVHKCKPNQANNRSRPRQGVCALLTHTEMQHPSRVDDPSRAFTNILSCPHLHILPPGSCHHSCCWVHPQPADGGLRCSIHTRGGTPSKLLLPLLLLLLLRT